MEKLKVVEEQNLLQESAIESAKAEIQDQRSIIEEDQKTIALFQESCQRWMELTEYYQLKCSQCSNALGQIVQFLQGTTPGYS